MGNSITRRRLFVGFLLAGAACAPAPPGEPGELLVHAAASLRDVAVAAGERFEQSTGTQVVFNFAGSNVLAQQIAATGMGDLLLSADMSWLDDLEARGCVVSSTRRPLLRGSLVVIGHVDSPWRVSEPCQLIALPFDHLAIAHPSAVPAGRYAKAWAQDIDCDGTSLWDAVKPRVTPAKDVRAALALVAADPRIVGIVYASDALSSEHVRVLLAPPSADQPKVVYGAAVLAGAKEPDAAAAFLAFLRAPQQAALFQASGMEVLP